MQATGAQIITTLLEREGVTTVAGVPGGCNLPLYDALRSSRIHHVLARHEQGAGFIAQGIARVTGRPAVCLGTSGPGATNLLTAIADAKLDSIPLVAITGQVPRALIGTDAFQEIDTLALARPITKGAWLVQSAAELLEVLPTAFALAASGRPGPVVIDVPKDVQSEVATFDAWPDPARCAPMPAPTDAEIATALSLLAAAERPLLFIGAGVVAADAGALVGRLAERIDAPVASTLHGLGALPVTHPHFLGMVGMHAARCTNLVLQACDLLIGLGVRFDDRATGKLAEFCPRATVIHVDVDRRELGKLVQPTLGIHGDVGAFLRRFVPRVPRAPRPGWARRVARLRRDHPLVMPDAEDPCAPYGIVRHVGRLVPADTIVTTDVGQHQMWAAQAYPFARSRQWLTSGGLGTMGFGLPAAIGAALAAPGRRVVCFTGDGSLLMNLQELATAAEEHVPITIVLLDNGQLGMVRQQQDLFYGERVHASRFQVEPDFVALARAFGIAACSLGSVPDPLATLAEALRTSGPCLVHVPIARDANVYPMVPPGAGNGTMLDAPDRPVGPAQQERASP